MEQLNTPSILSKLDKSIMIKYINHKHRNYPKHLKDVLDDIIELKRPFEFVSVEKTTDLYKTTLSQINNKINIFEYTEYNMVGSKYKHINFSFLSGYKQNTNEKYPMFYDYNIPFNQCDFKIIYDIRDNDGYSLQFTMSTIDDCPYGIYAPLGNISIDELETIVSNIFSDCFVSYNDKPHIIDLEFLCDYFSTLSPNVDIACT